MPETANADHKTHEGQGITENQNEETKGSRKSIYQRSFYREPSAWTAVFTGVLTIFSVLLYFLNKSTGEFYKATQRAYVLSVGIQPNILTATEGDKGKKVSGYKVATSWGNSGTTPTKTAIYQVNLAITDYAPSRETDFESLPQGEQIRFVFGPRAGISTSPIFMSLGDMESVASGRKHAFLWGWVIYRDIFPATPIRLSEFCNEIINPRWTKSDHLDPLNAMNVDVPPCPTHNCYDQDCPDYGKRTRALE
jgi:hypothetical protein